MTPLAPAPPTDLDWPHMLHTALDGCGMRAVYQPIIDLSRGVTAGYEALIRFVGYPERNPAPWFAAARRHDLNAGLQAAALRAALADRATLPTGRFLTVNITPDVLHTPEVQAVWQEQPHLDGIVVELTEDPDDYTALNHLRAAGATIAADSALTSLHTLRPTMIKLDRSLITGIHHDQAKRVHVTDLAAHHEAQLVAQGIEHPADLTTLAALHIPYGQGYHLGRPARPWSPITESAARTLHPTLREHLEHPPVVTDPTQADRAFTDPAVDLVVLCDEHHHPLAALDPHRHPATTINVDTALTDAALRTLTRDPATPLLCTDSAGRYVGVVRIPRLMHALSSR